MNRGAALGAAAGALAAAMLTQNRAAWAAAAIVGGIMGQTAGHYSTPRGVRNHNPGNIRHGGSQWQGMAERQSDPEFVQFVGPEWGIRALARLLVNYQRLHGLHTVRGIINRYAPPSENDTGAYVQHVAAALGVGPDESIKVAEHLPALVSVVIRHENGIQPYSAELIRRGIDLAGVAA